MKAKLEMGVFGARPTIDAALPAIKSVKDDVAVATAIGAIGGGVQRLLCSTAFYFGDMAKEKGEKRYSFEKAWKGFHDKFYGNSPLEGDAYRTAKSNVIVYAAVAQLPYDSRELAERMFDHKYGSQSQKRTALKKMIEDFDSEAPDAEEFEKLLPKKPNTGGDRPASIKARAKGVKTSIASIREDETLLATIESNDELAKRFDALETAASRFFDMAETIEKKAKANADLAAAAAKEPKADKAARAAAIAAAAKAKPAKGARPS